ncbi:MAG: serine/threonine protein kinase [Gammaproteobacteria bacterium]|jgi:hypothetical protein
MEIRQVLVTAAVSLLIVGCGGGDIKLNPTNIDNSTDNSTNVGGGGGLNPCANYTDAGSGQFFQGSFDGTNCTYRSDFVGVNNPLTVDLTIPFISGVHIFEDALFVGTDTNTDGVQPPQCGNTVADPCDGPTLTIAAGSTLAFLDSSDYIAINRGSRIIADGSAGAPITFTGFTDAVSGNANPEDVQLWGGMLINGNGITNNCTDAQRAAFQCHVVSEGQPTHYGGDNNAESSGVLRYVILKHTGFEVAPGDELNGITFNAVGSGTVVSHIEAYSTFDDGLEFFGGAVNVDHYIGLYVKDDSLDFSDGYSGTIDTALVIQSQTDGNRCIEGDNVGESRVDNGEDPNTTPISMPTFNRLICILANGDSNTHGDSEGILLRLGARAHITNAIVFAGEPGRVGASNECFEFNGDASMNGAIAGETTMTGTILACEEPTKTDGPTSTTLPNNDPINEWVLGVNPSSVAGADYSFNSFDPGVDLDGDLTNDTVFNFIELDPTNGNVSIVDVTSGPSLGGTFNSIDLDLDAGVPQTFMMDSSAANILIVPTDGDRLGAVLESDNWTAPWAYGLRDPNRAQPLWFE